MFGLSGFEITVLLFLAVLIFHERLPRVAAALADWWKSDRR
ncbi:MAG TPA: hypothetical protein VK843_12280 [Planctomycetota bacterium]|nr:hypothetical protein [Planctomycetota bacterium]